MTEEDELAEIKEKEARVKELEDDLQAAKEAYNAAIRKMHVGGKSLREIGQLLNLSHQRVHQIVESEARGWRAFLRPAKPEPACSICGLNGDRVEKLVQGPGIFACDYCITSCSMVLASNYAGHSILSGGNEFKKLDPKSKRRCSFCGKLPGHKRQVIAGNKHQVCDKCIELSLQYMELKPAKAAKVLTEKALEPQLKRMTVILTLQIERNSKWVRGKKRSIEDIEFFVLPKYLPRYLGDSEYELQVEYIDDSDLDEKMTDLLMKCHERADNRNCYSESSIKQKGEDRWWD